MRNFRLSAVSFPIAILPLCLLIYAQDSFATAPRSKVVAAKNITTTSVEVRIKKKLRTKVVKCLKAVPGTTTSRNRKLRFTSFADQLAAANKDLKKARSGRTKNNLKAKVSLYKALRNAGVGACKESPALSLAPYRGSFNLQQAQRLVEVFALGGKPGLADRYVSIGLNAAVADLTTLKPDPAVDNFRTKLTCGPNAYNTTNPDTCFEGGDINDFYLDGFVSGLSWRSINSANPAHMALFEWAMDQRAPGSPRVLSGCNRWMFPKYIEKVDRFVNSGDYKAYAAEWVQDSFIHGKWLSGVSNHSGLLKVGNEDFAREFLELFTTGRNRPNGSPVYNDFDVYQASLAMSGLKETSVRDSNNREICVIGMFPDLHRPGPKTLFAGTPNQMVVENAADMATQIFVKQRDQVAFELAKRLWSRFISSKGTNVAYQKLAKEIIASNFKLWPVMTKMMKSQAFYAAQSQETILKNPHTLLTTFIRMTGMPAGDYSSLSSKFRKIGMHIGEPPTVFGFTYQNALLASDVYQLERFNAFAGHMVYQNLSTVAERYGWTPHAGLVQGIPLSGTPAVDLVTELLKRLNMTDSLTQGQKDQLVQFLNYSLGNCNNNNDPQCFDLNGSRKKLYRSAPDLGDSTNDFYRLRLAYAMVAGMPAFGTM